MVIIDVVKLLLNTGDTEGHIKLSFVLPWIRQRFQASSGKNVFKLLQQSVVNQTVRGHGFLAVEFEGCTVEARHRAARLLHDQHTRRRVPGIEIELPEAIEASRSHITQIESGGAADPARRTP